MILEEHPDFSRPFEFNDDGNPALLALAGAVLAVFAMAGFENSANVAEEVQNPSRVFPRSLLGGMVTAGVIYLVISFLASIVTPTDRLADSDVALLEVVRTGLPGGFPVVAFRDQRLHAIATLPGPVDHDFAIMIRHGSRTCRPAISRATHHRADAGVESSAPLSSFGADRHRREGASTIRERHVAFLWRCSPCVPVPGPASRPGRSRHYRRPRRAVIGILVNLALLAYVLGTDIQGPPRATSSSAEQHGRLWPSPRDGLGSTS